MSGHTQSDRVWRVSISLTLRENDSNADLKIERTYSVGLGNSAFVLGFVKQKVRELVTMHGGSVVSVFMYATPE